MLFKYLKKQKEINKKIKNIKIMVISLNIPDSQKELYLESISILEEKDLENLYNTLVNFTKQLEIEENKNSKNKNMKNHTNFKKDEIKEKQKELNSFSFLINNL
ncbi:hypothetical protein HOG21_05065 [bacterium]|jgi:hypothetical protein|nr:hypothetical protein [bacterium]